MPRETKIEELNEAALAAIQGGGSAFPGFSGGVFVAAGDVNGDGADAAARMSCSNNLKQIGLGIHN